MGGAFGSDASVRWKIRSGKPKYQSSKNDDKETVDYVDKKKDVLVKEVMGFDGNDAGQFRIRLRVGSKEAFVKMIGDAKEVKKGVWELEVAPDGGPYQIVFNWGEGNAFFDEQPDVDGVKAVAAARGDVAAAGS